jgi:hypothetical protein
MASSDAPAELMADAICACSAAAATSSGLALDSVACADSGDTRDVGLALVVLDGAEGRATPPSAGR